MNNIKSGADIHSDKGYEIGNEKDYQEFLKVRNGWVCPQCGIDRTKEACPQGHTAALTGHCPMIGTAL